jgi:hypothetical protein
LKASDESPTGGKNIRLSLFRQLSSVFIVGLLYSGSRFTPLYGCTLYGGTSGGGEKSDDVLRFFLYTYP